MRKNLIHGSVKKTADGWFYEVRYGGKAFGNKAGYTEGKDASDAMTCVIAAIVHVESEQAADSERSDDV